MTNVSISGVDFKNPVIAASGTFGFGNEYMNYFDVGRLGGISSKGLTIMPKEGNNGMRIYEVASGIMNSVGLQNPGVEHFIKEELEDMKKLNTVVIANLGGGTTEDYEKGIELLDKTDVDIIELNISCPNVKHGGMAFGIKSKVAFDVVSKVRKLCHKPLMVKLSPNAEDIVDMAVKCTEAGADSISLVNTFKAMAIDINKRRPVFDNVSAGLSGPCIKPIALRMVYEVAKAVDVPVVGMGGISNGKDAIEFIMAGATAVQVGTANFMKPDICVDIIEDIEKFMEREGINNLSEIIGIIK
ncbi:dihydroorotate dehydrogenase B (NAD(+)), catalytic subunit [Clostridium pasteurianum DSM 525 = ATCC 6013]|uniref:Dihydroorotate dehydrogenase n=1 Tax=Clostridium pasteurianum DSM 525 = ATCC 6013 TaxID=1262449 RepID=A0A0H3J9I1_CLOPA|nr:dihydroorotate dehydrogenase [Clostridium pasteurianum]AJA48753.1 dihydroorotate dehydrogenase B (NAD(+)), catalytic subunit [Clostridium pasteurianum DSM 525 = ATCC 6013]AJA52741.1 dihydroorotate dehydrogenase B (NAD(+)), catalytic subunit [Clostridium pasteurianum DSM 525 = ATCC 6013]AOZ75976.1 diguanylate cyclase [Clostridium pasteurianum DSM 525 = ATCC 6013]AOZ79772.1 diguanylate cyclase [Clostridium pasteurianum]ELP60052.1 dihydroorotate dehydrogenase 1B [Clostridium pasteurianum DSM 5